MARLESPQHSYANFLDRLVRRLALPLPGLPAQLQMAPRPRRRPRPDIEAGSASAAAVAALLFPAEAPAARDEVVAAGPSRPGEPCLVLTRRTEQVAAHKREVCLPGGALDPGESAVDAALRELDEEIGVARSELRVLGGLTPVFIPVSGFRMEPFVVAAARRPAFRVAAHEVEALIELPLARLRDRGIRGERRTQRDGEPVVIPSFEVAGERIWGATAMVLAELCALLDEIEPVP